MAAAQNGEKLIGGKKELELEKKKDWRKKNSSDFLLPRGGGCGCAAAHPLFGCRLGRRVTFALLQMLMKLIGHRFRYDADL